MQCKELLNYIAVYAACQDAVTKKREDLNVLPEVAALVSCVTDQQEGGSLALFHLHVTRVKRSAWLPESNF